MSTDSTTNSLSNNSENNQTLTDSLAGLFPEEICERLEFTSTQKFRGKQIFKWISTGVSDFSEMTNLSKDLRDQLSKTQKIHCTSVSKILRDPDGTIKLQLTLQDGLAVETVLLTDKEGRKTACVSCQVGCPMGCAFCRTGEMGFTRNLLPSEIVEQFLHLEKEAGTLSNIVFMGMGEPMLNLPSIRKAVAVLTHKDGRSLSARRLTLSTSGVVKGIYNLADNGPLMRLAVSLTTADPTLREKLMPVEKQFHLPELREAIKYYAEKTGRRVTLEAALMSDVNTSEESAKNMINFAKGINVNINLIPWNPIGNLPFKTPGTQECSRFVSYLEKAGLNVTLRARRGRKIGGACGQLGISKPKKEKSKNFEDE